MPPVGVFAGLDAVRSSSDTLEGLPSREQLKQWIVEHDKIEKETEIFDSGELRKLKKFTKGEGTIAFSSCEYHRLIGASSCYVKKSFSCRHGLD